MSNDNEISVEPIILTRELDAPSELVFDAWTLPEHLKNWMFPQKGFTCEYISADITPEGFSHHKMIAPNGQEMWLLTKYEEINKPKGLIFRQYASNEAADIASNPMMARIGLEEKDGKTMLTLTWQPINPTQEEADAFEKSRAQQAGGWSGSFEQLSAYLETLYESEN